MGRWWGTNQPSIFCLKSRALSTAWPKLHTPVAPLPCMANFFFPPDFGQSIREFSKFQIPPVRHRKIGPLSYNCKARFWTGEESLSGKRDRKLAHKEMISVRGTVPVCDWDNTGTKTRGGGADGLRSWLLLTSLVTWSKQLHLPKPQPPSPSPGHLVRCLA